ncbi:MAG: alanyl-tRNA editing protein [Candidatus Aenigmarchaeota archaeon]|nr:alanyl-tRNA editing protein [Candidatus Aenigmarchaeota archaeon]
MSTVKLFWADAYQTSCMSTVTAIQGNKVRLAQTVFYAFSGGQLSDQGTIGGVPVQEAVKQGDKEHIIDIEYTLEREPPFRVGDVVEVRIDPVRRDRLRRLHSAAHVVYYLVTEKLGRVQINGSEIQPEKARMDFGFDRSITDALPALEAATNVFLREGHDIHRFVDPEKADLWWWEIREKGWKMPCGGTHVRNTKEVGPLKLVRVNKGKGRERIEMHLSE